MAARFLIACWLTLWIGCGKQPSPSPSPPEPTTPKTAPAADLSGTVPRVAPAAGAPADEAQIAALLNELSQAVRKYGAEQQRVPKTLEELVANGYLSRVPPAPAGKKFAINKNLQVYLAAP